MYGIIKNVISRGAYDLTSITNKINTLWGEGELTDEQRVELIYQARNGAKAAQSVDVVAKLAELEARVKALEGGASEPEADTPEEYTAGKWYYNGDKVLYKGVVKTCIAPVGVVCVWSPDEYPAYWE